MKPSSFLHYDKTTYTVHNLDMMLWALYFIRGTAYSRPDKKYLVKWVQELEVRMNRLKRKNNIKKAIAISMSDDLKLTRQ